MATATAERLVVVAGPSRVENLCPGCGPVAAARSFYCQTHIAALWREVWEYRPESRPRASAARR
jgi:hypothetical protein